MDRAFYTPRTKHGCQTYTCSHLIAFVKHFQQRILATLKPLITAAIVVIQTQTQTHRQTFSCRPKTTNAQHCLRQITKKQCGNVANDSLHNSSSHFSCSSNSAGNKLQKTFNRHPCCNYLSDSQQDNNLLFSGSDHPRDAWKRLLGHSKHHQSTP